MSAQWQEAPGRGIVSRLKGPARAQETGIDPYFRWALHTNWRGYRRLCRWEPTGVEGSEIQIIARAANEADLLAALQPGTPNPLSVPEAYREPVTPGGGLARHFSATVPAAQVDWLLANPLGLHWKLAMPMRDAEQVARSSEWSLFGETRDPETLEAANLIARELSGLPQWDEPGPHDGLLAIIDHGCPFLNRAFEDGQHTRVVALWDQGSGPRTDKLGWPWRQPRAFSRGRQLGPEALAAILRVARDGKRREEVSVYRSVDYLVDYEDPRRRVQLATHGGHLLDVLGGSPDPMGQAPADDRASKAKLAFIQLPFAAAMDSTGGSLAPHLLDGVRYAMRLCTAGQPLVVSISYGGQAGPHDGSSLIETAMDELLQMRANRFAIVLAAGNARRARCHVRRTVRKNRSALLRCMVQPGDTTDTHIEIWYERLDAASGLSLEFRVRSPQRVWSAWVGTGTTGMELLLHDLTRPGDVVGMLRHDRIVPNGRRSMALVSLAPTRQPAGVDAAVAEAGIWEIEVQLVVQPGFAANAVALDAWIERDDPARGSAASPPAFVDQHDEDDLDTLCSIATGDRTVRAGGFNLGTQRLAPYSAPGAGPRRPQFLGACEQDEVWPSIAAAATRSGEILRMNGTSVAAPVVARRLFHQLAISDPARPAAEVIEGLRERVARGEEPVLRLPKDG